MDIQTIGIVGAGLMGTGIAQECARAGFTVLLHDQNQAALDKGLGKIAANFAKLVEKNKLGKEEGGAAVKRVSAVADPQLLAPCDYVIEAATENFGIKQAILGSLERIVREDAVIATNTSSVSITKLAASLRMPGRLIGMHFFNPVHAMPLVEIIRGMETTDAVYIATGHLANQLGKVAIRVRNSPGFVVNRILIPMINESILALQEGLATAEEIDDGMKLGANQPIGPLALADLIGLDTVLAIMEVLQRDFNDPKYRPALTLKEMVDAGYLGRKSGRGFYTY
ncbi:MAG: 3-hydroxybutyryl-CoA dehydrogenase [Massilia sp.]